MEDTKFAAAKHNSEKLASKSRRASSVSPGTGARRCSAMLCIHGHTQPRVCTLGSLQGWPTGWVDADQSSWARILLDRAGGGVRGRDAIPGAGVYLHFYM